MIIRGKYNDISKDAKIADDVMISSFDYIGEGAVLESGVQIANSVEINSYCLIKSGTNIQSHTTLNTNTIVGENCLISDGVNTADETYPTTQTDEITRTPCKIGNNVIIGAGATLVCCEIGNNCVIGAGSVVRHDIPPNEVWAGNPPKFIMTRIEFDKKQKTELK